MEMKSIRIRIRILLKVFVPGLPLTECSVICDSEFFKYSLFIASPFEIDKEKVYKKMTFK